MGGADLLRFACWEVGTLKKKKKKEYSVSAGEKCKEKDKLTEVAEPSCQGSEISTCLMLFSNFHGEKED